MANRRALEQRATAGLTSGQPHQLDAALDKLIENLADVKPVPATVEEAL
jgi:hypothetical protein